MVIIYLPIAGMITLPLITKQIFWPPSLRVPFFFNDAAKGMMGIFFGLFLVKYSGLQFFSLWYSWCGGIMVSSLMFLKSDLFISDGETIRESQQKMVCVQCSCFPISCGWTSDQILFDCGLFPVAHFHSEQEQYGVY